MRRPTLTLMLAAAALLAACGDDADTGTGAGASGAATTSSGGGQGGSGAQGGEAGSGAQGGEAGSGAQGGEAGSAPTDLVHRVGRFDDSDADGPRFTWSGSSFRTTIDGSGLDVTLDSAAWDSVFFEVLVDGVSAGRLEAAAGSATYSVVADLTPGTHEVEIFRRNEGFFGVVQMLGFAPAAGTTLVATPRPYLHRIEVIGDSLTAGYGIEGPDEHCDFSAETENAHLTYGAVAARAVGAEAHLIAYSGIGVYQDAGGNTAEQMPERFLRTLSDSATPAWDFDRFTPEAVVVNLGTNDVNSSVAEASFVSAYQGFLQTIRDTYPSAAIFCVSWTFWGAEAESWVDDAVAQSGVTGVVRLHFGIQDGEPLGCDWHTGIATNARLGQQLADAFRSELGW